MTVSFTASKLFIDKQKLANSPSSTTVQQTNYVVGANRDLKGVSEVRDMVGAVCDRDLSTKVTRRLNVLMIFYVRA